MYLVLNSTDAARLQNRSALPDSPWSPSWPAPPAATCSPT